MTLWLVRLAWASLPLTAGPAAGDALAGWSTPPRTLAEVLLWAAWVTSLVALLAPHPIGLTVVRVVAPVFALLAAFVAATQSADVARVVVALVATVVAGVVVIALPAVSFACANGVAYGLAAYLWTGDVARAHRLAPEIESGMVWVNSQNVRHLPTPFGGMKASGIGREGGEYSFEFYCDTKNICIAIGRPHIPRLGKD